MIKVSALVSTYKSERFMRGCLEDLTAQTLFKQGALEIVVVVSGSPENELTIVNEYKQRFPNQITVTVTEREPMYQAWNRGIALARGEYLTNANTDDRHRGDAIELLAAYLDAHPKIACVYSNCFVSGVENETFEQNAKKVAYLYPRFFAPNAALHYQLSPQPMWRRSVHDEIGLFSDTLRAAGDYEFNLRLAKKLRAERIDGPPLGLYLAHAAAISFKDSTIGNETDALYAQARSLESLRALYKNEGFDAKSNQDLAQLSLDFGVRALLYFPPWFSGGPHRDVPLARENFERALSYVPTLVPARYNLALTEALGGNIAGAVQKLKDLSLTSPEPAVIQTLSALEQSSKPGSAPSSVEITIAPSALPFPSQQELTFQGLN